MATTIKKQALAPDSGRRVMEGKPEEPVIKAEYLRRKNALEKKANPNAPDIIDRHLQRAINSGGIPIYVYGDTLFIDWVASKDYVFRAWSNHSNSKKKKAKKK